MTSPRLLTSPDIGQAENALRAILETVLADTGTSYSEWVSLSLLATAEPALASDALLRQIVDGLKVSPAAARSTLDELSAKQLVTTSPEDPTLPARRLPARRLPACCLPACATTGRTARGG